MGNEKIKSKKEKELEGIPLGASRSAPLKMRPKKDVEEDKETLD